MTADVDGEFAHGPDDTRLDPSKLVERQRPEAGSPEDTPEDHIRRIVANVVARLPRKYARGQHEHGGVLSRKPVLAEALDEAFDQVTYLLTLEEQLDRLQRTLAQAILERDWRLVQLAYNLVLTGNSEGARS